MYFIAQVCSGILMVFLRFSFPINVSFQFIDAEITLHWTTNWMALCHFDKIPMGRIKMKINKKKNHYYYYVCLSNKSWCIFPLSLYLKRNYERRKDSNGSVLKISAISVLKYHVFSDKNGLLIWWRIVLSFIAFLFSMIFLFSPFLFLSVSFYCSLFLIFIFAIVSLFGILIEHFIEPIFTRLSSIETNRIESCRIDSGTFFRH